MNNTFWDFVILIIVFPILFFSTLIGFGTILQALFGNKPRRFSEKEVSEVIERERYKIWAQGFTSEELDFIEESVKKYKSNKYSRKKRKVLTNEIYAKIQSLPRVYKEKAD